MPSYPDLRLALPRPAKIAESDRGARARQHPYRDRRADRLAGAALLPQARAAVHHELPHPLSGICLGALADSGSLGLAALRWFHGPSQAVMAATPALAAELRARGFRNVVLWSRGVDTALFHPRAIDLCLPAPVYLSVGRVAVEKNLELSSNSICPAPRSWSATARRGGAGAEISRRGVSRRPARRGTGGDLCRRRRFRVPEQDRHVRPGAARGAGQRPAGCGFSGHRPPRRDRHRAGWRANDDLRDGLPGSAGDFTASLASISPPRHTWQASARVFVDHAPNVRSVEPEAQSEGDRFRRGRPAFRGLELRF